MIPTSAASRSSVCSWECRRESPGRGRQEAWSPPGEGAAPSCSVSGTFLEAVQGPARRKCRAALQSSVRFTPGPAVQLCLISSGIASVPTLNTILPWIHDYRSSLCDAFLGVSLSTPKGRRQLGLTRLRCGVHETPSEFSHQVPSLSQLPPPLEDYCCIRKTWRPHINALLLLKVLITLKASFAPVW